MVKKKRKGRVIKKSNRKKNLNIHANLGLAIGYCTGN
jgi:hypothetical protein